MLDKIARKERPFAVIPSDPGLRRAVWAEPKLVGEVAFSEWTDEGIIRHPSFQGLRQDKKPQDVVREEPVLSQERVWSSSFSLLSVGTLQIGISSLIVESAPVQRSPSLSVTLQAGSLRRTTAKYFPPEPS